MSLVVAGVEFVWASFETNEVIVEGSANAEDLRKRLEAKLRKFVTIGSYGVGEDATAPAPAPARRAPAPAPRTPTPPMSSPHYYRPLTSPPNYPPPSNGAYYYPYGPDDSLAIFSDENPNACSIQ